LRKFSEGTHPEHEMAGVQLISVTESIEDSASGKLVGGILASIAEFYSANLSQEIRKGIDQKASQGGWPTVASYGYRNIRREAGGRRGEAVLEPDEQAPMVVWAFEQYATGRYSLPRADQGRGSQGPPQPARESAARERGSPHAQEPDLHRRGRVERGGASRDPPAAHQP